MLETIAGSGSSPDAGGVAGPDSRAEVEPGPGSRESVESALRAKEEPDPGSGKNEESVPREEV